MRSVTSTRGRSSTEAGRISNPVTLPLCAFPDRAHADQRQRLCDVVAAGAHIRGAPGRQREPRRIVAVLLRIAFDEQPRRVPAELPRCRGRHRTGIEREEIAPGRQYFRPAAARSAAWTGLDAPAVETGQHRRNLGRSARGHRRPQSALDPAEHGAGAMPFRGSGLRTGNETQRQRFQPFDRVAGSAPRRRSSPSAVGLGPVHGSAKSSISGSAPSSRSVASTRSSDSSSPPPPRRARAIATSSASRRSPSGCPEHMQPVADLQFLQLAQKPVELLQRRRGLFSGCDAAIAVDPGRSRALQDFGGERRNPSDIALRRLVILVDQPLDLGLRTVAAGAGQGRGQVIDDDGLRPPFRLTALAGIVDDERVEMRQRTQRRLRETFRRQRQRLARQPFQGAVLAEVDHRIGAETVGSQA